MYKTIKKMLIQNAVPPQKTYKVCSPALAAPQDLIGLAEGIQIHKIRFR